MKINLDRLVIHTKRTVENIDLSHAVTFFHGPVSTGKSTIARLIDFCLGGDLEKTPAIQKEFISTELVLLLGNYKCRIERALDDNQSIRVSWTNSEGEIGSLNAPLASQDISLFDNDEVYCFSDLIFHFLDVEPMKVRKNNSDPESPLIRLSIRDLFWYCYLDQANLDSSFFHLEEPFRSRKSQDAMRFFTGLHSEELSKIENELMTAIEAQREKRSMVLQIRAFMKRFEIGSELEIQGQIINAIQEQAQYTEKRQELEHVRFVSIHPTENLRNELRILSNEIDSLSQAVIDSDESIEEQKALLSELITAKTKGEREKKASELLSGVKYIRCPECGQELSEIAKPDGVCQLCGNPNQQKYFDTSELEAFRKDINERIDQIEDSLSRRKSEILRMTKLVNKKRLQKVELDKQLQEKLTQYDSAYIETIRDIDSKIAVANERLASLRKLQQMPLALTALEEEAGALQGKIDIAKSSFIDAKARLVNADRNIRSIAEEFKRIMIAVQFPGIEATDEVKIDPRNWRPVIIHDEQTWSFWETGSGGKKTLFNVCYALALHSIAIEKDMPMPSLLIIDSPTKNISDEENPELVKSLYKEVYNLARKYNKEALQLVLVDSDLVLPDPLLTSFSERRLAGEAGAPSLIPYYSGP
jgi:Protein of unknown function (DUF3732).